MSNQLNYKQKIYIGTGETDFKHRFNNHKKSFNLEQYEKNTDLSKEYWTIKCNYIPSNSALESNTTRFFPRLLGWETP